MSDQELEISYYVALNGRSPFRDWFESLRDFNAQAIIHSQIDRLSLGNFGKCKVLRPGLFELRINYGPGYRIYFGRTGSKIILLLCGGNKSTQTKDVANAYRHWKKFKESQL